MSIDPFPPDAFSREDSSADAHFYSGARLVTHIDDGAIAALSGVYRRLLTPGARVLDLMSSWRAHLPHELVAAGGEIIGHGMNAAELRNNPQLSAWFVQDINRDPALPFADSSFSAVTCAVSVQYMTNPLAVFREVARVLAPGGPFIVSFSNRMFPTKAVRIWRELDDEGHISLVTAYFQRAVGFDDATVERHTRPNPAGWREWFGAHDPLYAVIGRKSAA